MATGAIRGGFLITSAGFLIIISVLLTSHTSRASVVCEGSNHNCPAHRICVEFFGSYQCVCSNGSYGNDCELSCSMTKYDLAFVVDSSSSINQANAGNYQRMKDFMKGMVDSLVIGGNDTNIGLVKFSTKNIQEIVFSFKNNSTEVNDHIDNMAYDAGHTYSGQALNFTRTNLLTNSRAGVPHVVLIVTDGAASDDVIVPSRLLHEHDVIVFALGVGCCVNRGQLNHMATDPDATHVFRVDFEQLPDVITALHKGLCEDTQMCNYSPCLNGATCTNLHNAYQCNCAQGWTGTNCQLDVDECADGSGSCPDHQVCINVPGNFTCVCAEGRYGQDCSQVCQSSRFDVGILLTRPENLLNYRQTIKDFVTGIVKSLVEGQNNTRFGLVTYSTADQQSLAFQFNATDVLTKIQSIQFDGRTTFTGAALNFTRGNLFPASRNNLPRLLLVLTDSTSADNVTLSSELLRDTDVIIYSIGIGSNYVAGQLSTMATDPDVDHVLAANLSGLFGLINPLHEKICKDTDNCFAQPCKNGGRCVHTDQSFYCICPPGFNGNLCQNDIDECFNDPCINYGFCVNTYGSYECHCSQMLTGRHCQIVLQAEQFDLVFLVDGSESVGQGNFQKSLAFITEITSYFNISTDKTNVALVIYSNNASLIFNFNEYSSITELRAAIGTVSFPGGSRLNTSAALEFVRTQVFPSGRNNAPDILVLTSASQSVSEVSSSARRLHDDGVNVISVGFGSDVSMDELYIMASDPDENHVFTVLFEHMDTVEGAVAGMVMQAVDSCVTSPCRNRGSCTNKPHGYNCTCASAGYTGRNCDRDVDECSENSSLCPGKSCVNTFGSFRCVCSGDLYGENCSHAITLKMDILFLLDGSDVVTGDTFIRFLSFVKSTTHAFDVSENGTRAALMLYSNKPQLVFDFDDTLDQSSLENAVDQIVYPNTRESEMGEALIVSLSELFQGNSSRRNATQIVFILTSSKSQDDIEAPSFALLQSGVKVITVGVGSEFSTGQLKEMASEPDEQSVFTFKHPNELASFVSRIKAVIGQVVEPCGSVPCNNGGNCSFSDGTYHCDCAAGYEGKNCESEVNKCSVNPCINDGKCMVLPLHSYHCNCTEGWTGRHCETANSCLVLLYHGFNVSGPYTINPDGNGEFSVFCDMTTDGGGWTVNQRRQDGTVNFDRDWDEYRDGFGDVSGEFWLGNDRLHRLTVSGRHSLRVDLEDWGGNSSFAEYASFVVSRGSLYYGLTLGVHSGGSAGDALESARFSTRDRDNDGAEGSNCASNVSSGGWWFGSAGSECGRSFLNGRYSNGAAVPPLKGVTWVPWRGNASSLRRTVMMIRGTAAHQEFRCSLKADIIFINDGSASANQWGEDNFQRTKRFILGINNTLTNIGADSRLFIVQYGSQPRYIHNTNNWNYPAGDTFTGNALNYTIETLNTTDLRSDAAKLVVVITDGCSNDDVSVAAKLLRDLNWTIISIGLGPWYDLRQLQSMASRPTSDHVMQIAWSDLLSGDTQPKFFHKMCLAVDHCFRRPCQNGGKCTNSVSSYSCNCTDGFQGMNCEEDIDECATSNRCVQHNICINFPGGFKCTCAGRNYGGNCGGVYDANIDLAFLVDGSSGVSQENFEKMLVYVKGVSSQFNASLEGNHISVAVYSDDAQVVFPLNAHYDQTDINNGINDIKHPNQGDRNVGKALQTVHRDIFNSSGRPGAQRILVVITSGNSTDIIYPALNGLSVDNVRVIGVSMEQVLPQALEMASSTGGATVLEDFSHLPTASAMEDMKSRIIQIADPCSTGVCFNGSTCVRTNSTKGYMCECGPGYTGSNCADEISKPCSSGPCQNGARCIEDGASYKCVCLPGYTSFDCEEDLNECDGSPCLRGQCVNTPFGRYTCNCPEGYAGVNCEIICQNKRFNLGFVVDGSYSIEAAGPANVLKYKNFIKRVVRFNNVSREETHVASVLYSTNASVMFTLNQYHNASEIEAAIDAMMLPGQRANLGAALNLVRRAVFAQARLQVPNVLLIMTDGIPDDEATLPAQYLKDMGLTLLVLVVGDYYSEQAIRHIASSQEIQALNFDLSGKSVLVQKAICEVVDHCWSSPCYNGAKCTNHMDGYNCTCAQGYTGSHCEKDEDECETQNIQCPNRRTCVNFPGTYYCLCAPGYFGHDEGCQKEYSMLLNIVFLVVNADSVDQLQKGNFDKEKAFVTGLSQTFNVTRNDTRAGIIVYSDGASIAYRLMEQQIQTELQTVTDSLRLSGSGHRVGEAMELSWGEFLNSTWQEVDNVRNVLVVITNDGSDDDGDVAVVSHALRGNNVSVFSVGVGRYREGQLKEMASDPKLQHVYTIDDYVGFGPLIGRLKDAILQDVEPCLFDPCLNGATCNRLPNKGFTCTCAQGWTGTNCGSRLTECTRPPSPPCKNGAVCSLNATTPGYSCKCSQGWTGNTCEQDVNECDSKPCKNGGNCTNIQGGYRCNCPLKTAGQHCEALCLPNDINVGFLVDASGSIEKTGNGTYQGILDLVKNLAMRFPISRNQTNIGMAIFSEQPQLRFSFNKHFNVQQISDAITSSPHLGKRTLTGRALLFARKKLFTGARRASGDFLIVVTDGVSQDYVRTPARQLRDMNVTVYVVVIGENYDERVLKLMANVTHIFKADFANLEDLYTKLRLKICEATDMDECDSSPCLRGGTCVNTVGSYKCLCPVGYHGINCGEGCGSKELGIKVPNPYRIPDSDMSASSKRGKYYAASRARVGLEQKGPWQPTWCAALHDKEPYVQVYFGYLTSVAAIEVEGISLDGTDYWVDTFYVSVSNSSATDAVWTTYKDKNKTVEFETWRNRSLKKVNLHPTPSHFIRIHPIPSGDSWTCMRIALYGCDMGTIIHVPQEPLANLLRNSPLSHEPLSDPMLGAVFIATLGVFLLGSLAFLLFPVSSPPGAPGAPGPSLPIQHQSLKYNMTTINQSHNNAGGPAIPPPPYEVQSVEMDLGPDVDDSAPDTDLADGFDFQEHNKIFGFNRAA